MNRVPQHVSSTPDFTCTSFAVYRKMRNSEAASTSSATRMVQPRLAELHVPNRLQKIGAWSPDCFVPHRAIIGHGQPFDRGLTEKQVPKWNHCLFGEHLQPAQRRRLFFTKPVLDGIRKIGQRQTRAVHPWDKLSGRRSHADRLKTRKNACFARQFPSFPASKDRIEKFRHSSTA